MATKWKTHEQEHEYSLIKKIKVPCNEINAILRRSAMYTANLREKILAWSWCTTLYSLIFMNPVFDSQHYQTGPMILLILNHREKNE